MNSMETLVRGDLSVADAPRATEGTFASRAALRPESREVEEQELGGAVVADTGERELAFVADGEFAADQLYPGVAPGLQLEVERIAAVEQRCVDAGVLVDAGRAVAAVVRSDQTQLVLLFRARERAV